MLYVWCLNKMIKFGTYPKTLSCQTAIECADINANMSRNVLIFSDQSGSRLLFSHGVTLPDPVFGAIVADPFLD